MRRVIGVAHRFSSLLKDVSLLHLGLSALTRFVLMNLHIWNRLYQQFQSLWGFSLKLCKTADMNSAKLSLAIC